MSYIKGIKNEELLKAISDNTYNSILITESNLELPGPKVVYVNEAFIDNTGYTLEDLKDKTPRVLQGEETDRKLLDELKAKCIKGEFFSGTTINYRKDGTKYYVQWNISPIKNKQNEITHYVSIQRNITKELETITTLQKIIDLQQNIVVVTDGLRLTYVNESFKNFFNVESIEEFLEQDDCICSRFNEVEGFYYKKTADENWIENLQKLPSESRIVTMLDRKFLPHGFFVSINDFGDNKDIITFTDITESIGEKESLKHKAYHDNLSGAYNREFLNVHFEKYKKSVQKEHLKMGLIMFDIDHFKQVNDTYGHNVGDEVIKKIVTVAKDTIRSNDYLIRWGGEEFIVLTKVKTIKQLKTIAEHIRTAIENDNFAPVPKVTSSFGITLGDLNDTLGSTVQKADDALYIAKEQGRNQVIESLLL